MIRFCFILRIFLLLRNDILTITNISHFSAAQSHWNQWCEHIINSIRLRDGKRHFTNNSSIISKLIILVQDSFSDCYLVFFMKLPPILYYLRSNYVPCQSVVIIMMRKIESNMEMVVEFIALFALIREIDETNVFCVVLNNTQIRNFVKSFESKTWIRTGFWVWLHW